MPLLITAQHLSIQMVIASFCLRQQPIAAINTCCLHKKQWCMYFRRCFHPLSSTLRFPSGIHHTGWSKETVNCNFFLTGLKITKSGITEPFLVRAHREVLIFWCLEGVRWKKYPILGLCQNGGLAPARPDSAWTEPARHLQTLQDNPQTFLRIVWECLLVSFYAWFIFGNVRGHLGLSWGDVSGCFRCSEVFEGVTEG